MKTRGGIVFAVVLLLVGCMLVLVGILETAGRRKRRK